MRGSGGDDAPKRPPPLPSRPRALLDFNLAPLALVVCLTLGLVVFPLRATFPGGGAATRATGGGGVQSPASVPPPPPPAAAPAPEPLEHLKHLEQQQSTTTPAPFAQTLANTYIAQLQSDPGYHLGPLVVGGIGDSGTRAVREVLRNYGVQMLAHARVNGPGDSEIFQSAFPVTDSHGRVHELLAVDLYTSSIKKAHRLNYEPKDAPNSDQWQMGRQWIALQTYKSMNYSRLQRTGGKPLGLWGFKHPRTALMLPFLVASLGSTGFRFLHVLRDPKEVVFGNNQQVFDSLCEVYYGRACERGPGKKLEFWVDLNRDIYRFAVEHLGTGHYLPIRIEDLVLKEEACYQRVAEFAGHSPAEARARFRGAVNVTKGHEASYFGHTVNADARKLVYDAIASAKPQVREGMEFWGFSTSTFRLTYSCERLPTW